MEKIRKRSITGAQMTFITGRRRVGKTSLMKKAFEGTTFLYFFIAKKSEELLCAEFVEEVKRTLQVDIFGQINTFEALFAFLMNLSKERNFTLVLDEFQEFYAINPSVYSSMQNIWDAGKDKGKINLVLCGSVYSLMYKIFENAHEPLFGRADNRLRITPFELNTLKEILNDYRPEYTSEDLLTFYMITGGIAKYVELLVSEKAFCHEDIMDVVLLENSFFVDEGKNVLVEEFGRDYTNYFSILSLIASSKTSRSEIESVIQSNVGGFLDRLEKDYDLIQKVRPVFSKPGGRLLRYRIKDNFLNFWFRFFYKYWSAVEIGNIGFIKEIVMRDYKVYSGIILERYFLQHFIESKAYSQVGAYWERKNQNEIDVVAVNDLSCEMLIGEVKRNKDKINPEVLKAKAERLITTHPDYHITFTSLSMEDM